MDYKTWLEFFNTVSPILSGAARGSAEGLVNEANLIGQQNQGATSRYQAMVNAGRLQNIEQPQANMDQATRGTMLSTWKPVSVGSSSVPYGQNTSGPVRPTITGGPSMTPELQQFGGQVAKDAMARQLGGNVNSSTFPSDSQLGMTPMPEASRLDKILGYAATGSSILGAAGKAGLFGGGTAAPAGAAGAGAIPATMGTSTIPGAATIATPAVATTATNPTMSTAMNAPWWKKALSLFGSQQGYGTPTNTLTLQQIEFIKRMQEQQNEYEGHTHDEYGGG